MQNKKKLSIIIGAIAIVALVLVLIFAIESSTKAQEITVEEAQTIVDSSLSSAIGVSPQSSAKYMLENTKVTVNELTYGDEKNIILSCSVSTIDAKSVILGNLETLLGVSSVDESGRAMASTQIRPIINEVLFPLLAGAEKVETTAELVIYDTKDKGLQLYKSEEAMDICFGGVISAKNEINSLSKITVNGEEIDLSKSTNLRRALTDCTAISIDPQKPDTSNWLGRQWNNIKNDFYDNFIEDNRYMYIVKGLGITLLITFLAVLLGIVLGFTTAIIRCTNTKTGKLKFLNAVAKAYLTVIRGTPVVVQLMIMFFVILAPLGVNKIVAAVLCFGINSGAYVAEIVRGAIESINDGQMEAGRSLGFNYVQTMWYIILPQAFKTCLPSLANEFIVLLKETSVASYIGINDLTRGGNIIRSVTFSAFMPLVAVAIIYLIMVMFLSYLVSKLERRLRKSDRS